MLINGTAITEFNAKIKVDFVPQTTYALNWFQVSSGYWFCVDRGNASDKYDTEVRIYGKESLVNDFINSIDANRLTANAGPNVIQLSDFNSQEYIFGADIDYTDPLDCTVFMSRRIQNTWKGYGVSLKLALMSPAFAQGGGALPPLYLLDVGYDGDSAYSINKFDSYNRTFFYQDHLSDAGSFTGTFTFTNTDMINLRRFVATNRSSRFLFPSIAGVAHPFGRRSTSTYCKLINFQDQGMTGMVNGEPRWRAQITFVESN